MNRGLIVAITGQSGSGKSSFSNICKNMGHTVIDCDVIAAEIHRDDRCKSELVVRFGNDILSGGNIDKAKLSQKAFGTQEGLKALTDITHPFIIDKILGIINDVFEKGEMIVFVDGAVIIGHSFEQYCDKIILIISAKENQYRRLIQRDNITRVQAQNRIAKQTDIGMMLNKASFVAYNNSSEASLFAQANNIINQIIEI